MKSIFRLIALWLGLLTAPALAQSEQPLILTSITANLIPSVTSTYNLGSPSRIWANVYSTRIRDASDTVRLSMSTTTSILRGTAVDGASAVGVQTTNANTLSTAGAIIHQFCPDNACAAPKANVDKDGFFINPVQTFTVADNGGGTAATGTLLPTSSYVKCVCNDANGCTVTLDETGVQDGTVVNIVTTSSTPNLCNFADTAGVTEIAGAFAADVFDVLRLMYVTSRWVEIGRSNN